MPEVNTNRIAYDAVIDLAFEHDGVRTSIQQEKIIYVLIEHDYEKQVLPIIYIAASINNDLYTDILKYKNSAKFYLNIKVQNQNSGSAISRNTINGTFNYIPSDLNPNYQEDLSDTETIDDAYYRRIMIGLVSIELMNTLRKSFNGIYNNIDQKTLVGVALEGTNCIIEDIKYNQEYSSILIPPVASRYKLLEYIFSRNNFYDTKFRYFMDFERSYLVSKRGDPIDAGDGDLDTIIVDIRSVAENEAYYDGVAIRNGSYYFYVNPSSTNVTLDEGTEKVANQIIATDYDSEVQQLDMEINNLDGSETKHMFVRSDNAALFKNELETNTVIVELVKQHIDGSIFTPNKCIMVNNFGEYSKYDGKYLIIYKREFFKCDAGKFIMSCNIGLKKVGNIENAGALTSSKSSIFARNSFKRTTSANKNSTAATNARRITSTNNINKNNLIKNYTK